MMRQYAVFGDPIAHSKSPLLHNRVFLELGVPAFYGRYHLKEPSSLLERFHALGLEGANITVPFKEVAFEQCDEVRGIAQKIGSVNTMVKEGERVIGYNTDAEGFFQTLEGKIRPQNVLILGAGGTAKALAMIFDLHQIPVTILNRTPGRLKPLAEQGFKTLTHEEFAPNSYDLIINSTSAGLSDDSLPLPAPWLESLLHSGVLAYDVIYGKTTPFLRLAKAQGARFQDGREMLISQAALSSLHFTEHHFPLSTLHSLMRLALPQ